MSKIIAIAQQKGGSGKTTLAAHLAVILAQNAPLAILDVDPQGSLGEWFERREARLGAGAERLTFRTASGWGAKREAKMLARDHQLVIVDTPPKSDLEARHAIEAADLVLIPMQPTAVDLWATRPTLELTDRSGPLALIVLNRVPAQGSGTAAIMETLRALGASTAAHALGNRIAFSASMGIGAVAPETAPGSKAAREAESLAQEIADRLR